jgi:hypothetical protein
MECKEMGEDVIEIHLIFLPPSVYHLSKLGNKKEDKG